MSRVNPTEPVLAVRPRRPRILSVLLTVFTAGVGCTAAPEQASAEVAGTGTSALAASQLTVTLRTWSGHYLVADKGGGAALMAYSTVAKDWETFTLTDVNGGSLVSGDVVTLQGIGGQWASAINGGGSSIQVTATAPQSWEQFSVVKLNGTGTIVNGDKIALKTTLSGQFLSAVNAGGGEVNAAGASAREWETLTLGITSFGGGGTEPDFGPNVLVFDPSMSAATVQSRVTSIFKQQETNQFGDSTLR